MPSPVHFPKQESETTIRVEDYGKNFGNVKGFDIVLVAKYKAETENLTAILDDAEYIAFKLN